MRRSRALLLLLGLLPGSPAQAQVDTVVHFPLPLVDLAVRFTVKDGVWVSGAPNMRSVQGTDSLVLVSIRLHPDSLLDWTSHAEVVLSRPVVSSSDEVIQWTRPLRAFRSAGSLMVGRSVKKGRLRGTRWLSLGDSTYRWHVDLSGEEADSLLRLLFAAAAASGPMDTVSRPVFEEDSVDVPVEVVSQPRPNDVGPGRVVAQYVVGPDGRAEPGSIVFLLASSDDHMKEARAVLLRSRYRPAIRRGEPVRQLVQQNLVWRHR